MLSAIIGAFAVRMLIGEGLVAIILYSFAIAVLMISALYAIHVDELLGEEAALRSERRRDSIIGWTLALSAVALRLPTMYSPMPRLFLVAQTCWGLFFGFITWNQLRGVLRLKEITGEAISMAISVYLLLGFTWGFVYDVIYQLQPSAFSLNGVPSAPLVGRGHPVFPVLSYFSFITLTSIGYGDIAPVTLQARFVAMAEGVTGQFFLAVLVARLVSMQILRMTAQPRAVAPSRFDLTRS